MQQQFKISINNNEYVLDARMEHFLPSSGTETTASSIIPLERFRSKDGTWYILWDKEFNTYYKPETTTQFNSIPLSVEWTKVTIPDAGNGLKERLDLIVLLSESIGILRGASPQEKLRKPDSNLKKSVHLFIAHRQ